MDVNKIINNIGNDELKNIAQIEHSNFIANSLSVHTVFLKRNPPLMQNLSMTGNLHVYNLISRYLKCLSLFCSIRFIRSFRINQAYCIHLKF